MTTADNRIVPADYGQPVSGVAPNGGKTRSGGADAGTDPDVAEVAAWRAEFEQRCEDARAGVHHPLIHELILRMPPLHDSFDSDAQIFAERLLVRLAEDGVTDGPMIERLKRLSFYPTREAYRAAAEALEMEYDRREMFAAPYLADAVARCDYYAAVKGCQASAFRVAGLALSLALDRGFLAVVRADLAKAAFGWLLRAGRDLPAAVERFGPERGGAPDSRAEELGREAWNEIMMLASVPNIGGANPMTDGTADACR
jgi:hypothetical protein